MEQAILEDILVFVAGITAMGCLTGILITYLKRRGKQALASPPELVGMLQDVSQRLERLDGAVDTIAVEIERISEAQRFTTRLLAERGSSPPLPDRAKGAITPH